MNVSYLNRLREQIAESQKKADPPLSPGALIILRIETPVSPNTPWETRVSPIFQDTGWAQGGVDPPSLIFVLNEEAYFYFSRPKSSMNALLSTASSICTKADAPSPVLYQCSASHLTNIAEVLAYFVLETDRSIRTQAENLMGGVPLDHMTKKEFQKTLATSHPQFNYAEPGVFYRLPKPGSSSEKGWESLAPSNSSVVKISKTLSFDTFEENVALLFNRS